LRLLVFKSIMGQSMGRLVGQSVHRSVGSGRYTGSQVINQASQLIFAEESRISFQIWLKQWPSSIINGIFVIFWGSMLIPHTDHI